MFCSYQPLIRILLAGATVLAAPLAHSENERGDMGPVVPPALEHGKGEGHGGIGTGGGNETAIEDFEWEVERTAEAEFAIEAQERTAKWRELSEPEIIAAYGENGEMRARVLTLIHHAEMLSKENADLVRRLLAEGLDEDVKTSPYIIKD